MSSDDYIERSDPIDTPAGTYRVRVEADPHGVNPREEYDQLGTMVLSHRRYDLPLEGDLVSRIDEAIGRGGLALAVRYLSVVHNAVVLPVYGYDHGQLRLKAGERTYPFSDPWDSGIAGVIYAHRADIAKQWEGHPMPTDEKIASWLAAEVEAYDTWANGEMAAYVIERSCCADPGCDCDYWHEVDSCCGYYSVDEAMAAGRESIPEEPRCNHNEAVLQEDPLLSVVLCDCGSLLYRGVEYRPVTEISRSCAKKTRCPAGCPRQRRMRRDLPAAGRDWSTAVVLDELVT